MPAPSIEPAVMPAACESLRSILPAAPLMKRAVPPVLVLKKTRRSLLVMVALPAVLASKKLQKSRRW